METAQSVDWIRQNELYEIAQKASIRIRNIFTPCLNIQDEKILIIGDKGTPGKMVSPALSGAYYLASEFLKLNAKLVLQEPKTRGEKADDDVIASLSNLGEGSVVIVNGSDKLGSLGELGKSFRKFCEKKKIRFVSSMSLGSLDTEQIESIVDAIDINYKPLQTKQQSIKELFDEGEELRVKTKAGTDFTINIKGMKAVSVDGVYTGQTQGGNLPAGEVYIPVNGKRADGVIIIDGSSRTHHATQLIKDPIKITVVEGSITNIEGKEEAKRLKEALDWAASNSKHPNMVKRVGEFGIGLNPKAKIIGSIVIDEKVLGSAHIGIGSNYWCGGSIYSIIHLDQVFKDPIITIDKKKLDI